MCEGDCDRTILHFAVVLFILKPTNWRSEAAHYESASKRRRRCRAPFLHRGDSTFLTSGVNWSLGIKKNKPEPPVLSDAIAHLCQSSRGSSSNLDLDCRSWFSTPRSLPHDFHRAARSFSVSFVWSVEGLSLTDAVQTSKPFAAFGIGAHQYSQQKCRRGDWIWGGIRVQVRLSTCQLRFCRLRSSLCVKKKNSSRLPCLGAGSVFISALTHFVLDHNGCMSVKWLYSDLREQTCYRMSSGFSIWPPGCDLTRLPSHGVTILFLCRAVYRAITHHTSVYSNLWGPPDCSISAWTVCVRACVRACVLPLATLKGGMCFKWDAWSAWGLTVRVA